MTPNAPKILIRFESSRKFQRLLLAAVAALFVALPATLPAQRVLTLKSCIDLALGESPLLEADRFDLLAATEDINAARAATLPKLDGTVTLEAVSGEQTSTISILEAGATAGVGVNNASVHGGLDIFGARLRYPIFEDGSIFGLNVNTAPAIAAKRARREALEWTRQLSREEVIYRITNAYITTVSAQSRIGLVQHRVSLLENAVANTEAQQKQGTKLSVDIKLAKAELGGARSLAQVLRGQSYAGRAEMATMLGLASPGSVHLSSELPDVSEPPDAERVLSIAMAQHPSVQVQRGVYKEAKENYRLERYRLYPSVALTGSALYVDDFNPPGNHVFVGGVTVSVPIWDFGAQLATVRSKRYTAEAERARLDSVAGDVTNQIVQTYADIALLSQNILTLQGDIAEASRNLQVAQSQQQQGLGEPLTAVELEVRLDSKQDELQSNLARRLVLYAALQRAAGGMWKWLSGDTSQIMAK
jgi:multidrug efflux system outer membrane protein